jgi:hypothetical protein
MSVGNAVSRVTKAERRGILEFDVSSLAGQTISSATVSVRIASVGAWDQKTSADELNVSLYGFVGDGAITAADFSATATALAGPFLIAEKTPGNLDVNRDPSGPLTADLLLIVDVTAFVQSLIDSSSTMAAIRYQSAPLPQDLNVSFVAPAHAQCHLLCHERASIGP